jgi:predicted small lipoprotein YifL
MFRPTRRSFAVAALTVAGLALAGCGRKAGLDLPPSASAAAQPDAPGAAPQSDSAEGRARTVFGAPDAESALPPARAGKKAFVLDPLLD